MASGEGLTFRIACQPGPGKEGPYRALISEESECFCTDPIVGGDTIQTLLFLLLSAGGVSFLPWRFWEGTQTIKPGRLSPELCDSGKFLHF